MYYILVNIGNIADVDENGNLGNPNCTIRMPAKRLKFQSGRLDCLADPSLPRPYFTNRQEAHPRVHVNGPTTVQYYLDHFKMGSQLSVALHGGAHSFGEFNDQVSALRYTWTRRQEQILNNQFFKILALKRQWYAHTTEGHGGQWKVTGDIKGLPGQTDFYLKKIRMNKWQFFHVMDHCPSCADIINPLIPNPAKCCKGLSGGNKCKNNGCYTRASSMPNDQETAIPADVGLYWHFDIDPSNQEPIGCTGFPLVRDSCQKEDFEAQNDYSNPEGPNKPLWQIVEEYANDQDSWIDHFFTAMEAMLSNGYGDGEKHELNSKPHMGWLQLE